MPAYSKETTAFHREKVRQAMVILGPKASQQDIVDFLSANKLPLTRNYVAKLREKIIKERRIGLDWKIVNEYFGDYEDSVNEIVKRCWKISLSDDESTADKLKAMREIREAKAEILETIRSAGISKTKLGETEHKKEPSPQVLAAIECIKMQFNQKVKPVIYEEELPEEKDIKKDEPEPENPNIHQLPNGATFDDKGPAIEKR